MMVINHERGFQAMLEGYSDIMTIEELCEILIIGKNAAYHLLNNGDIQAFRIGSRWKIPKESVITYILHSHQG